nr:probable N-acetyltransferase HLS1 [Ipomoea trifida]
MAVVVRDYDPKNDCRAVEEVERICEVGPGAGGKLSIFTDLLGDPICRVRNSPSYQMLVAEVVVQKDGGEWTREIVGMIRGCIKTVTCGKKLSRNGKNSHPLPVYAKVAYILGLRVSPFHRRMGIGLKLVTKMEEWFRENGAEYSYMATENDNEASINLFTNKCGYSKFREPSILVQPVFAHRVRVSRRVTITKLSPGDAEVLYRRRFSATEFFPRDIDSVLRNSLNLGTVWNSMEVFKLEVRGASRKLRGFARTTRLLDRALPWLRLPSVPEVFRPFGLHFLYGLGGEGPLCVEFITALCGFAHNLAKQRGCGVVATEVAADDPLVLGIPHWKTLSCADDLWCIKRLGEDYSDGSVGDWTKSQPSLSIFVDPREV